MPGMLFSQNKWKKRIKSKQFHKHCCPNLRFYMCVYPRHFPSVKCKVVNRSLGSIKTSYCEQQGKHQTPYVIVLSMQLPNSMRRTVLKQKGIATQYRYKDRYVDADGCSNFCAVGLFLKHQTDRKWPHLGTSTRETHEHDCTWWLRRTEKKRKRTRSFTQKSPSGCNHTDPHQTYIHAQMDTHLAVGTWGWWDEKVKCGALVIIVACGCYISVWINVTLSKISSSMPSASNDEEKTKCGEMLLVW